MFSVVWRTVYNSFYVDALLTCTFLILIGMGKCDCWKCLGNTMGVRISTTKIIVLEQLPSVLYYLSQMAAHEEVEHLNGWVYHVIRLYHYAWIHSWFTGFVSIFHDFYVNFGRKCGFIRNDFSTPIAHVITRNESVIIVNVSLTAVQVKITNNLTIYEAKNDMRIIKQLTPGQHGAGQTCPRQLGRGPRYGLVRFFVRTSQLRFQQIAGQIAQGINPNLVYIFVMRFPGQIDFGHAPLNYQRFLASNLSSSFRAFAHTPLIGVSASWQMAGEPILWLPRCS